MYDLTYYREEISTNTLRTEGDYTDACLPQSLEISTNTLRTEGDASTLARKSGDTDFNQHPPHGG